MSTATQLRPTPRATPRPVYLSETSPASIDTPQVAFLYEQVGHLRIWSYIGTDRTGKTLFSGAGGGLYNEQGYKGKLAHAFEGMTKMLADADHYGAADIYINNFNLRNSFAEVMSHNDKINVVDVRPGELAAKASKLFEKYGRKIATSVITTTDAALSQKTGTAGAGWVMVFGAPLRVYGGTKRVHLSKGTRESLTAELLALKYGIEHTLIRSSPLKRGWGRLTLRSDSQQAIRLMNSMIAGESDLIAHSSHWAIGKSILELLENVNVEFVWVRGHNGDEMNEFADRLAKATRRNAECGVEQSVDQGMIDGICNEAFLKLRSKKLSTII